MRTLRPLALLLLSACSLGGRLPGGAAPPAPEHGLSRSTIERSIGAGRIAIDSAARAADTDLMRPHFTADAAVEIDGTAGRGADAFADHLRSIAGDYTIYRVQLIPALFQHCTDGASESRGELLVAMHSDTVVAPYSARWLADNHGVRLQRLTVGDGAERAARQEVCPSRAVAEMSQRRLSIWVLPPYASAVHWNNSADFERQIRGAGYGSGRIESQARSPDYRGSTKEAIADVGAAGLRVRLVGQLALEASGSLKPSRSIIQGRSTDRLSHLNLQHEGMLTSAALSHEWRRIRLGAGPVFLRSDWRLRETAWRWQPVHAPLFGPTHTLMTDSIAVQEWKSKERGMAIDIDYGMPMSRFFVVNVRGQYRTMASTEIRTTHIAPPTVSLGGYTIGTSFGLTF